MWDYDSLLGKARVYFERAQRHPHADDEEAALWLLLGLEFLLRAPVAKVSPTLLADPQQGDNILHAAGFPNPKPDAGPPKSIGANTVILRLARIIPDFTQQHVNDANLLTGLRNAELHSGNSPLATGSQKWLPRFMRVTEVICAHLEIAVDDLLGEDITAHGESLVDAEDKRLDAEIAKRIREAKNFVDKLESGELAARRARVKDPDAPPSPEDLTNWTGTDRAAVLLACPACGAKVAPAIAPVRTTNERLEDDEIVRDVVYIAMSFSCPVCSLSLSSTAEISSAGLNQQFVRQEVESLADRYIADFEPDYGND